MSAKPPAPKDLKPSNFAKVDPMSSVYQKSEAETVARNIMTILQRTGDTWRKLGWREYKAQRQKDGHFSDMEKYYYNDVVNYTTSVINAAAFSPAWSRVAGVPKPRRSY